MGGGWVRERSILVNSILVDRYRPVSRRADAFSFCFLIGVCVWMCVRVVFAFFFFFLCFFFGVIFFFCVFFIRSSAKVLVSLLWVVHSSHT